MAQGFTNINPSSGGGGGSVTSANFVSLRSAVQANSAQLTSVNDVLSNRISIVSAAMSNIQSAVSVVSQALSVETANRISAINVVSNAVSIVSQALSVETAARVAAINTVSNAVSIVSQALSVETANRVSAINVVSNAVSIVSNALSAEIVNRISADNALSNFISANFGNQISILSVAVAALSNNVSNVQSALNVASNQISIYKVQFGSVATPVKRTTSLGVSATTLTNIGLGISVSAGVTYQIFACILYNRSGVSAVTKLGLSFPGVVRTRGKIWNSLSILQGGLQTLSTAGQIGVWNGASATGSVILSNGISTAMLSCYAEYTGVFMISTGGTINIQMGVSATTQGINIKQGSFIRLYRL